MLSGKRAHVADHATDLVTAATEAGEEPPQPLRRNVLGNAGGENAGPRLRDGDFAQISAENLKFDVALRPGHFLHETDGQGIDFLARGAAWHPDANFALAAFALDDFRNNLFFQRGIHRVVAEKSGYIDQQIMEQGPQFLRVRAQHGHVVVHALDALQHHAPADAPLESGVFVKGEIDARTLLEQEKNLAHGIDGFRKLLFGCFGHGPGGPHEGMAGDASQLLGQPLWRHHRVHATGVDGAARHVEVFCRGLVFGEGNAR
ncbi:MAG TPA: hypothetical protein VKA81_07800, partial [Verrucomicrobiae bacterium]|nr:hypothetical protein [Verrucomicrobiae bacterium]